jgi:hypothetical protein
MTYAVMLSDRPNASGVLLMVDERDEAEEIAFEVRRAGHRVEVRRCKEWAPGSEADVASPSGAWSWAARRWQVQQG